jgi:hypothetical protein
VHGEGQGDFSPFLPSPRNPGVVYFQPVNHIVKGEIVWGGECGFGGADRVFLSGIHVIFGIVL